MNRPAAAAIAGILVLAAIVVAGANLLGGRPAPSPTPTVAAATSPSPLASNLAASPGGTASGSPAPSASPSVPAVRADQAIVAVAAFRSTVESVDRADVQAVANGTSSQFKVLEVVASDADAVLAALGVARPDSSRFVAAPDVATLSKDLAADPSRLGFLAASAVWPGVRALGWGGATLFGTTRVKHLAEWPLHGVVSSPAGVRYDPAGAWTLVAGGDILLDRGVAQTVKINGKGVDFPFDGGTADITSRYCCSSFGWNLPRVTRTGHAGALRTLLRSADLAIANFENPAPNHFTYHTHGTIFSADPRLIDGLRDAGIDFVSLGNNHIRDAGAQGILDTVANLDARGIAHGGAGRDLAAARVPGVFNEGGTKVAILSYDTIAKAYAASPTRAGSAQLTAQAVHEDVAKARAAGADLVIVFPHWGTEYNPKPFKAQQQLAHACIDAGADLVIGNHAHWAGAVEVYKGKPIWYALGNFVFDQTWSEPTMEGITLELTFNGATLVQARMRPHIILDKAQPNFLDPAGDGRVVLGQIFGASKGLLPW